MSEGPKLLQARWDHVKALRKQIRELNTQLKHAEEAYLDAWKQHKRDAFKERQARVVYTTKREDKKYRVIQSGAAYTIEVLYHGATRYTPIVGCDYASEAEATAALIAMRMNKEI